MPRFAYVAINATGQKINGEVESSDRASVISFLKREPITIISVNELKVRQIPFLKKETVKLKDLVVFSRQLATLVKTGVPLVRGLGIISAQADNKGLKNVINSLQVNIESGRSLSESLANYPHIFSAIFINMVRAGEMGGALDAVLDRIAAYLEEADKLARRVRGAMIYPIIVITMSLAITSFIFIKVIPSFKDMFLSLGLTLPLPTRIIIAISDFVRHAFLYVVVAVVVIFITIRIYLGTETGRLQFDRRSLKLPLFGDVLRKVIVARFSRTLATLVKSGISILNSLNIVSKTADNLAVEQTIESVRARVSRGEKIGESLRASGRDIFAPLVIDMISVGEETGNISPMLDKIADFYETEVDASISTLMSLLEPVLIIFLGGIVGMIALSMFLPILEIIKKLGH